MKRFSSNITDEELYREFRNAAKHYDPKLNDSERKGVWESIAYNLLSEKAGENTSIANKWKRRCIALLMLWLLTGGLAIFRIIQLQEISERKRSDATTNTMPLKDKTHRAIKSQPVLTARQPKKATTIKPVPIGYADVKKNITPYNCLNNNYTAVMKGPDKPLAHGAKDVAIENLAKDPTMARGAMDADMETPAPDKPIGSQTSDATTDTTATREDCITDSNEVKPPPPKKRNRLQQHVSIGLATGTEWSKMPHDPIGRTGVLYGLTLQYRFAPRWSVVAGIMVTPKLYSTTTAFNYSFGTTPGEQKPIDVNCRIIDIQMNIRYDVMHKRDGRLFTGAGLSSFRIQKEDYTFYYQLLGNWVETHYKLYNENDHLFAAANIMAGYEHSWRRLSLQAMPYLKIPLTHIGLGQMDLMSSGLQFSVKYAIW